ncbi:MAG: hypothetical protein QOH38_1081 [Thermoleophilaceae bacterium]|jgi:hypothetical protein|nr:hypothetical protein [Thermoleophilaceae bacterium]
MGRLVVGMLVLGLAAGLAIGLSRDPRGPVLPRLERAITKDARHRYGHVKRTRCVRYQRDPSRYSCTAIQFESALSYTGQVYVAQVFPDGRFRYRPYKIPIWLGI